MANPDVWEVRGMCRGTNERGRHPALGRGACYGGRRTAVVVNVHTVVYACTFGPDGNLILLRAAGATVVAAVHFVYARLDVSSWPFGVFVSLPDAMMRDCPLSSRNGAIGYKAPRTSTAPIVRPRCAKS